MSNSPHTLQISERIVLLAREERDPCHHRQSPVGIQQNGLPQAVRLLGVRLSGPKSLAATRERTRMPPSHEEAALVLLLA